MSHDVRDLVMGKYPLKISLVNETSLH